MGRKAIFANAVNNLVNSTCLVIIYFIVCAETSAQFIGSFAGKELGESWYSSRPFYVILLSLALFPFALKKQLAEFKWLGTFMFASVAIFLITGLFVLGQGSTPSGEIWRPKYSYRSFTSILTIIVAYSYQTSVFPVFNSLAQRTPAAFSKVQTVGLGTTLIVYVIVALIGVSCFGDQIRSSVLLNYGDLGARGSMVGATYLIQLSFIIVLICHIPFIFYAGKEGALMFATERQHRTVSNAFKPNPAVQHNNSADTIPFNDGSSDEPLRLSPSRLDRIAYRDLSEAQYFQITVGVYLVAIVCAISIDEISTVFSFVAAFSVNSMAFFFPATFFLRTRFYAEDAVRIKYTRMAWLFIVIGVCNFIMGISAAVLNIID